MNIVILDDHQDVVRKLACASRLDPYPAKVYANPVKGTNRLVARLRHAEAVVLIGSRTQLTRSILEKLPDLRMISQVGLSCDHIDLQACTELGIAVARSPLSPRPVAELTWALVLAAARRLPQYVANLKQGVWQQSGLKAPSMPDNFSLGTALHGQTLGIWGYGQVGRIVAGYGHAFGMQVLVWGSDAARARARADGFATAASRSELFHNADVLSLHLRLSDQTRGIVGLDDLNHMRRRALLVNTSAAELLNPDALVVALSRGRPGMAAIDVFESEPILRGHALLRMENCICTPHIGYVERNNYEQAFATAFDNIIQFERHTPVHIVNPQALHDHAG